MPIASTLTFGDLLRRHRTAARLTQEELAAASGLSPRGISDLERGARKAPRRETLLLLAEALHLSADDRAAFEAAARRRPTAGVTATGALSDNASAMLAPGRPVLAPLVGRDAELRALEKHLAGSGAPSLLLFAGEPGIGKSRLLQEAARLGEALGLNVLAGGCQRRLGQEPYTPFIATIERFVRGRSATQRRADLKGCAWLARLLPELAGELEPLPAWTLPPEQERRLMFAAVAQFLANICGPNGLLLLLDDLQWAGADAVDLLASLTRGAAAGDLRLRLVGAYRDTHVRSREPLTTMLGELAREGVATQVALGPLLREQAEVLLDELLVGIDAGKSAVAQGLAARTGGVPFFVVSCAQALTSGVLDMGPEGESGTAAPWDVTQSVRQRVLAVPELAQETLGVAAVAGRQVTRGVLLSALLRPGRDEGDLLDALDAACAARLLAEDGPDAYAFPHDLVREVVADDLSAARRALYHRRLAEALEQAPGDTPLEDLAYHFERAGEPQRAVAYLQRSAERALAMHANAAAEGSYRALAERLGALGRAVEAAQAREKLGTLLNTLGRYDEALETLDHVAAAYRGVHDDEGVRRVTAAIGRVYFAKGDARTGLARMQPLLDAARPGEISAGLALLYAAQAHLYFASGRYGEQLDAAQHAVALATELGDDGILAQVERRRGLALVMLARMEEAVGAFERSAAGAEAVGDLATVCRALDNLAAAYRARGMLPESQRYAGLALEAAERLGDPAEIAAIAGQRGETAFYMGEWARARADFERSAEIESTLGETWASAYTLLDLGELFLAEGDEARGIRYLEGGAAAGTRADDIQCVRQAQAVLAEHDLIHGRAEAALARLTPLLDRPGLEEREVSRLLGVLAWAYAEAGRGDEARETISQAVQRLRAQNERLSLVDALRFQALIALRLGTLDEAATSAEECIAAARALPFPYAEARALRILGDVLCGQGNGLAAREALERAIAIFRRLGAAHELASAEAMLADERNLAPRYRTQARARTPCAALSPPPPKPADGAPLAGPMAPRGLLSGASNSARRGLACQRGDEPRPCEVASS